MARPADYGPAALPLQYHLSKPLSSAFPSPSPNQMLRPYSRELLPVVLLVFYPPVIAGVTINLTLRLPVSMGTYGEQTGGLLKRTRHMALPQELGWREFTQ